MSAAAIANELTRETQPRISVLIPTYNYARFLPQAIESVLAQSTHDFELLISDDASIDDSAAIIKHYAALSPRIRHELHHRRLGMVQNWNHCLQRARGEYVQFLFGDDLFASDQTLSRMSVLLDEHPDAMVAASPRLLIDANSHVTGLWNDLSPGLHEGAELIARCLRKRSNLIGEPSTVMFRRSAAHRGFDPAFRQVVDLEMWFHFLLQGRLVYATEPLCAFRRHESQQTTVNHRSYVPHLEMLQLLDRYVGEPQVQVHLPPRSWTQRRLVFCQRHYARKAAGREPRFRAALQHLDQQLPWHWTAACWLVHRVCRPFENLRRKLRTWRARIAAGNREPIFQHLKFNRTNLAASTGLDAQLSQPTRWVAR